jgi:type II restriction enzyme
MARENDLTRLKRLWPKLSTDQQSLLLGIAIDLARPMDAWRNPRSNVITTDRMLLRIGDYLKTHHALSNEPFKKEKFEYALEKVLKESGIDALRSNSRTDPFDLVVNREKWSLKTQANRDINRQKIWISKMMELGAGWDHSEESLRKTLDFIMAKIAGTDRIFTLRCLLPNDVTRHEYELLEIPKSLLVQAPSGLLYVSPKSRVTPPAAYCRVQDGQGVMFDLYFDGGGEQKLHVKDLRIDLCERHATWSFTTESSQDVLTA